METRLISLARVIAPVVLMATGCSSVRQVELDRPDQWMAKAQRSLLKEEATITMKDGSVARGTIVTLNADSLSLQGKEEGEIRSEALNRIVSIRPDRRVGAVVGGIIGGCLLGALLGGAIAMENEEPQVETLGLNTAFAGMGGAAAGALIGMVAGGVVVGIATAVTDYNILQTQVPVRPPRAAPAVPDSVQTPQ